MMTTERIAKLADEAAEVGDPDMIGEDGELPVAESQLVDALIAVLECGTTLEDEDVPACTKARSLREAQYLTSDEGLVVTLANGQKFVLIVKEG